LNQYNNDDRNNHKRNETYNRAKKNACVCLMHDFSAVDVDKLRGMKKNGFTAIPYSSFFLPRPLVLFVSTIVACFWYCLQTFLYIISIDKNRQTNRHHGYIFYTYVNPVVNFRYAHKCIALFALVCAVAETRVALSYVWIYVCEHAQL